MPTAAIGPGVESVLIYLWAASPDAARWDRATWDGATWGTPSWQSVGCDTIEATAKWGASQEAGILSVAEAGELDFSTFDPARELDPLNTASPYYGAVKPGTPVRIAGLAPGELAAGTGFIDEVGYDLASAQGRIRAVDGIAYLSQAQVPDGTVLPNTLRARVRAVVAAVGLTTQVPVEDEATPDPDVDPPVSPFDGKSAPAWQVIADAGEDALVFVYVGPLGILRFRSWSAFPDAPVSVGCPPDDPTAETWLSGVSTIRDVANAQAIRNRIRAYSSGTTWQAPATDGPSILKYGPRPFDVQRVVPGFPAWSAAILQDRADAGLGVSVGEIRPYTQAELAALLTMVQAGPQTVRVRDDEHGDLVDLDLGMIGATLGITAAGWRWELVTMLSRVAWDDITPEPPVTPIPPPDPWHVETRTYIASSDALIALTSGGAKYGAGAASSMPFGTWSGWTYRGLVRFPSIPTTKVRALRTATLKVQTSTQVRIGFGSAPKSQLRRITANWSAGSSSSPSGSNAVVWPGPTATATGAVTVALPAGQNAAANLRCDAIARAWLPASAGGSGAPQYGIAMYEAGSSGSNTGEVWPVEQGGAARPTLELVVEVFD